MIYWVWLQKCLGYGTKLNREIFEKFNTPEQLFKTDNEIIKQSRIFTDSQLKSILKKDLSESRETLSKCRNRSITVITCADKAYPESLKNIDNFPLVLYVTGKIPDFDNTPSICIVGPRKVSEFGFKSAYSIAGRLSKAGFVVVSGGAVGSDTAAHMGAIQNGGRTVAVLPCGIGYDYLKKNEVLREKIKNNCCLISEFPPDFPLLKNAFSIRNRILSGLTLGTVIVEASTHSGTLITASYAVNQGKDVFVIPGNPTLENYKGSNNLLRDGAKPLIDLRDVFYEYIRLYPDKIDIEKAYAGPLKKCVLPLNLNEKSNNKDKKTDAFDIKSREKPLKNEKNIEKNLKKSTVGLSKYAEIVYNCINVPEFFPDDINGCELDNATVMAALGELEIFGYIRSLPGGRYSLL